MSGGSMNYIYNYVLEASELTHDIEIKEILEDLSKVLHEEEWWQSADKDKQSYLLALSQFKAKWFSEPREERLKKYIDDSLQEMKDHLYSLIGGNET